MQPAFAVVVLLLLATLAIALVARRVGQAEVGMRMAEVSADD